MRRFLLHLFSIWLLMPCLILWHTQVEAISLGELIDTGGSLEVGDKLFSDFQTNRPFVEVETRVFSGNDGLNEGLNFSGTSNLGSGSILPTSFINFTVTVLDPNFYITRFRSAVAVLPFGTGTVQLTDKALVLGTTTLLSDPQVITTMGLPGGGPLPIVESSDFTQGVTSFRFMRTVEFSGPLEGNQRFNMSVSQTPIPEPSTMLLFGTGLAGLVAWRYRKNVKS